MSGLPSPRPVSLSKAADSPSAGARTPVAARIDSIALVMARNAFYKQHYQKILYLVLAQLAGIALMGAVLVRLFDFTASREYYFPIQTDNKLIVERGLYEPVFSEMEMKDWARKAMASALTFGYYDYLMRWQAARSYFTPMGWASFTRAMDVVKITDMIGATEASSRPEMNVVLSRVRPGYQPEIKRQGILGGVYVWDISVPIDVTFYTQFRETRESWNVDMRVVRMSSSESRFGRGIAQLNAEKIK